MSWPGAEPCSAHITTRGAEPSSTQEKFKNTLILEAPGMTEGTAGPWLHACYGACLPTAVWDDFAPRDAEPSSAQELCPTVPWGGQGHGCRNIAANFQANSWKQQDRSPMHDQGMVGTSRGFVAIKHSVDAHLRLYRI